MKIYTVIDAMHKSGYRIDIYDDLHFLKSFDSKENALEYIESYIYDKYLSKNYDKPEDKPEDKSEDMDYYNYNNYYDQDKEYSQQYSGDKDNKRYVDYIHDATTYYIKDNEEYYVSNRRHLRQLKAEEYFEYGNRIFIVENEMVDS